jgi:F-type H+-transporting ATPase subunit delta
VRTTSVARRYAKAAFEVAREKGDPQSWVSRLEAVSDAVSDRELLAVLRSPSASAAHKITAIESVFPDLTPEQRNLVRILIQRHRIELLPAITAAFSGYLDEMLGRTEAGVVSARPLSGDELRAIQDHLNIRTGRTVKLKTSVDEALIGGVVMRVGDDLIDASVATKLERLRQKLA